MNTAAAITVVIPMFRSGVLTAAVVEALHACRLPPDYRLKIIVVDDASGDGSGALVSRLGLPTVDVLTLERNAGRSAARNHGAAHAQDGYLLFLDSDCVPSDPGFLEAHLAVLESGANVSMGLVDGADDGFWHAYQAGATRRRVRASEAQGIAIGGSSQNVMTTRKLFIDTGGFDEGYQGYGFEDRDLFLRMANSGHAFQWAHCARVVHRDALELRKVCEKMAEAGGAPAIRFQEKHPEAYRLIGYGKLDARCRPWLRSIEPLSTRLAKAAIAMLDKRLNSPWIPLAWRLALVRAVVAACYLCGTVNGGLSLRRT
ncbi:glycosyltransferase [Luteibacter sp. SG786]|uniref:glycosyltransferase family 2 protein n=1 Tax=Luteibacter sp. SG786 TaxID=2587130 RepID=UPI0014210519|nr:glycosyltransferase [Luteibacter sp. SG786]NII53147.1 GT2 family glycosyltransferase [Luteibacter sp. SG786]